MTGHKVTAVHARCVYLLLGVSQKLRKGFSLESHLFPTPSSLPSLIHLLTFRGKPTLWQAPHYFLDEMFWQHRHDPWSLYGIEKASGQINRH